MSIEQVESRKLARRAQHDLTAFVEEWKNLQERKAYVEMEIIQHRQETEAFEEEHKRLAKFAGIVDGLSSSSENGQWDPVLQALLAAESLGAAPTANEDLSNIAVAAVYPFLRQRVEGWQPLEDPKLGDMATLLYSIRHILGAGADQQALAKTQVRRNRHRTTAYESMIYKVIFPKVVSAIHGWDAHNPTPLLTFFDAWKDLLPPFVRSQILDQAIVNKLHAAVSAWNPRKRRSYELPHLWLFPWLPYLSPYHVDPSSSSGLVGDVKRKFRHLIDAWDYAKGVIPGLSQWREILQPRRGRDYWTPLIMGHVLPGMSRFLKSTRHFQVDPNDQAPYMPALQGILAWSEHGILTPRALGQVLVETIFPMWHDVLHQWLTVVGPNEEIGQWFEWWRDQVFPENIKNLAPIQAEFQRGHEMIIHALDLGADVASMLPAPTSTETIATTPDKPSPTPQHIAVPAMPEEISFRQQIEDWCIDNDLQFLPEKRVLHAAGPLYRITAAANGKLGVLVYFRGDEIWAVQRAGRQGESTSDQDVLVHWASEEGRDVLLGMAWLGVK